MTIDEMIARKKELGYSNEQIAEMSGLPLGTVQKIFGRITKSPRHSTVAALEKILKKETVTYPVNPESGLLTVHDSALQYNTAYQEAAHTVSDYWALPKDCRAELIDGRFYNMAAPEIEHQIILLRLWSIFDQCIREHGENCLALAAPVGVQLDQDLDTMVEPDVMILCNLDNLDKRNYYGAPDFVAEILSPSTRSKDMLLKLKKYGEAGVREYWIVDPKNQCVLVYDFEHDVELEKYSFDEVIPLRISGGKCSVDFSQIKREVSRLPDAR